MVRSAALAFAAYVLLAGASIEARPAPTVNSPSFKALVKRFEDEVVVANVLTECGIMPARSYSQIIGDIEFRRQRAVWAYFDGNPPPGVLMGLSAGSPSRVRNETLRILGPNRVNCRAIAVRYWRNNG